MAHKRAGWLHNPCPLGIPDATQQETRSDLARKLAGRLRNPCHFGAPQSVTLGDKMTSGPQVGRVATQPLPPRGLPTFYRWAQNEKCPTRGPARVHNLCNKGGPRRFGVAYKIRGGPQVDLADKKLMLVGESPTLQGGEQKLVMVAHKWAAWLHKTCSAGGPKRCTASDKIRNGPKNGRACCTTPAA